MDTKPRRIIHLDLDAFFCSVEELRDSSLRGKPFAVGGSPDGRGVVASCSYPARKYGVRSAMPTARAIQLCPNLLLVRGHHSDYGEASRKVMSFLHEVSDLVEQVSIDEAFIDVTANPRSAEMIAHRLQKRIRDELGLPCSVGIASNKLVAKIANDVGKISVKSSGPPSAFTIVPPGTEADFLAPLPVEMLWGVGPKTAGKLRGIGINTIGDLAAIPQETLIKNYGKIGWDISKRARGLDNREIVTERHAKSVSQERTYAEDVDDRKKLHETLLKLTKMVAKRLVKKGVGGRTIKLKLRWQDFTTLTRQTTLHSFTNDEDVIYKAIIDLFEKLWEPGKPVRLLGVGVSSFESDAKQLNLFDYKEEARDPRLEEAIAQIQERFGETMLHYGIGDNHERR